MNSYIGSEHIISPLTEGAQANFDGIYNNETGVRLHMNVGIQSEDLFISKFDQETNLSELITKSVLASLQSYSWMNNSRSLLILSTTKGEINYLQNDQVDEAKLAELSHKIAHNIGFKGEVITLSNACISGVLGIVNAHDFIQAGCYDEVIVCGGDLASLFTISGFQSFFAISNEPSKPYDANRKGINLGEGAASVILSNDATRFSEKPLLVLGGATANDANHISGPSRTGEGLYRSITNAQKQANIQSEEIGFLSAHGTATAYNDEMESIAFDRAGLKNVPSNSLKGYFGHTLGAAGLIESAITLQGLRKQKIVCSAGFEELGVSKEMAVIKESREHKHHIALKTASGFGGCNASVIFKLGE